MQKEIKKTVKPRLPKKMVITNEQRIATIKEIEEAEKKFSDELLPKFKLLGVDIKGIFGGIVRNQGGENVANDFTATLNEIKLEAFNKLK